MKANDWQDTIAMAASAIEDLLETADEQAGCWADVPARLRALTAPPAPAVPTPVNFSENADADMCRKWAWEQVKEMVSTDGWTVGDNITYFGFFCWGWDMRRQYNEQRSPVVNPEFTGATAVPDGYCIMPLTLTAANGAKGALSGEFKVSLTVTCNECGGDGCMDCNDRGELEEEITVPWSTIKDIYRAAVDACRSAMLAQPVSQGYTLNSPEIPDGCQWTFDEHDYKWDSGCGEAWMFSDGGPTENGVKFCQSCGKPVLLAAAPEGGNGA